MSKKSPQLRFEGFTDAWEERKLGELGKVTTGKAFSSIDFDEQGEYLVITNKDISNSSRSQNVITDRINISDKDIVEKYNLSGENILVTMDGVNLGKTAMYSNEDALLAQRVGRIQSTQLEFIYQITSSSSFLMAMRTLSVGNAIKHISLTQISNYSTLVPSNKNEQQKIGSFFKQLDDTIALHQRKLDLLKEQKKGYLQKMFPKNGDKVPELRFAGFADDWEERKLGDILSERNDQMPETNEYPLMSFVQGKGVTPKGERYNRSFLVKDSEKKYKKTKLGDFIYSSNNLETGSIGFNRTGKAVISPVYSIFESKKARESLFIGIMSARKDFISEMVRFRQGVVYGQWRIHESDFLNINIKIPNDKEQHLIISLFESIDNTIALHQRKLDLLKEQKKGFLQKMFF